MIADKYIELGAIGLKLWNQNIKKDAISTAFAETLCDVSKLGIKYLFVELCDVISQIDCCNWQSLDSMLSFIEEVEVSLPNFYEMSFEKQKALSEIKKSIIIIKEKLQVLIITESSSCYSENDAEAFALWGLISDENKVRILMSNRL